MPQMSCPICQLVFIDQPTEQDPLEQRLRVHVQTHLYETRLVDFLVDCAPTADLTWPLYIRTYTRQEFHFLEPERWNFDVEDLAVHLSRTPRFLAHTKPHAYNNADHSLRVMRLVPPRFKFPALVHEIAELGMGDMPSPLKRLVPGYKRHQRRIEAALFPKLGINYPLHQCIKDADLVLLKAEHRQLMDGDEYVEAEMPGVLEYMDRIEPMDEHTARSEFLRQFEVLHAEWVEKQWH